MIPEPAAARQVQRPGARERCCPACGKADLVPFAAFPDMPAQIGVQWPTRESARNCRRGSIRLAHCPACGFVTNVAFLPGGVDYEEPYNNDLAHSPRFREYEHELIERLTSLCELQGRRVVEIGCGNGGFLTRLCAAAGCRGSGYDPSLSGDASLCAGQIELVAEYYPGAADAQPAELIVCRQVFEHIPEPLSFLERLRAGLGDGTCVYFEVPSFDYVLDELALWTVIYEHCSYFTAGSLAAVFRRAGFSVQQVYRDFDSQFLGILATPAACGAETTVEAEPASTTDLASRLARFTARLGEKIARHEASIAALTSAGKRVVVWGAGARTVSYLNLVKGGQEIPYVVDINPDKAGRYLPGTGQRIVEPSFVGGFRPDAIIVMNGVYLDEIRSRAEAMGIRAEYLVA